MSRHKENNLYVDLQWQDSKAKDAIKVANLDRTLYKVDELVIASITDDEIEYINRYSQGRYMTDDDKYVLYVSHASGGDLDVEPIATSPTIDALLVEADKWLFRWTENLLGNDR